MSEVLESIEDRSTETPRSRFWVARTLIAHGHRWKWLAVVGLGVLVAVLETIAAISVGVLVASLLGETVELDLPVLGSVSDLLSTDASEPSLWILAIAMIVLFLIKAVLVLFETYALGRVADNTGARLASLLFRGYLYMPYEFHLAHNSAELIRNASWAADEVVTNYLKPLAMIATRSAMLLFLGAALVITAPGPAIAATAILLPITVLVLRIVKPSLLRLGVVTKQAVQDVLRSLQQSLHGIRDVKILAREQYFADEYARQRFKLARARYLHPTVSEIPRVSIETLVMISVVSLVALWPTESEGSEIVPVLGLFAYAGLRLMPAMAAIISALNHLRYGSSVAETLAGQVVLLEQEERSAGHRDPTTFNFKGRIEFRNVSYAYEAGHNVLEHIDLVIKRGQTIGIVGETGAGKSTLIDLILGLIEPTDGEIAVDDNNLIEIRREWQTTIGLVPQTLYLLDDSIRRNIAYGVRPNAIDEEAVLRSIQVARLNEYISSLPLGLDTIVGERGVRLSGGQRQRVAIARALYRDPDVLILDEGTASLDSLTEAEFMKAIEGLKGTMTIIMVAHRLTTVRECDQIILVHQGRIVDTGGYDELRQRNDRFRSMTRQ